MIRIGDREYRDFSEYANEQLESPPDAEPGEAKQQPENEDRRMLLDALDAHKHAHEPTGQRSRESLQRLVGPKAAKDWERIFVRVGSRR